MGYVYVKGPDLYATLLDVVTGAGVSEQATKACIEKQMRAAKPISRYINKHS